MARKQQRRGIAKESLIGVGYNQIGYQGERTVRGQHRLDGKMIPRSVRRSFDQRGEPRIEAVRQGAQLVLRGQSHVIRVANISNSGAMLLFAQIPHIGEAVTLQLAGLEPLAARVCWVRAGRVGIQFDPPCD